MVKTKLLMILTCLFLSMGLALAQTSTVTGVVISEEDGQPVIGASVIVKGTLVGGITDVDGKFTVKDIPSGSTTLVVSFIGMRTQEVGIQPNLRVVLQPDAQMIDDVVVVAYGSAKKSSLTGAISSISNEELEKRPVSNDISILEGTVSGVHVNNSIGQPGKDASIRIRGIGTVNGSSSPLYIIDGVPFGGNISDLNPADIDNISVLKDAASCALYGNRASNGVILITTKRGTSEKVSMEFKVTQGTYTRGTKEYDRLNAYDFMEAEWWNLRNYRMSNNGEDAATAGAYASSNLISDMLYLNIFNKADDALFNSDGTLVSDAQILSGYADDLDWYDQATRAGYRQEYTLNGGMATDKSNVYFSIGYLDEEGYTTNSDFNRLTGRISNTLSPTKWLKTGFNLSGSHQTTNNANGNGDGASSYTNVFMYARNIAPIYPVHLHNADGSYRLDESGNKQYDPGYYTDDDGNTVYTRNQYQDRHVIWENELDMDKTYRNTLQGTAYADIKFLRDFTFTVKGDINVRNSENQTYNNATIGDGKGNSGRAKRVRYRYKNYTVQELLNWNHSFNSVHNLEALLGHENYYYNYSYEYGYKTTETFAGATYLSNFSDITSLYGYDSNYRTESYFARVRYNYDDKYNVEASFRRDGSSRFAKDARWGNFGSIGANWVISREEFMKSVSWVDNLKLRANWGQEGNDAGAGYYVYMALYVSTTNANQGAYYLTQNSNLDLKWETGESWDVAVETRLFDRWNLEVEYFDKRNKDLLFDVYSPLSAGATSTSSAVSTVTQNLGTIANRGFEISTDVDIYRSSKWLINFGANASFIKNKVLKLPEQNKEGIISGVYKIVEGKSRYEFFTYDYVGVDQLTGHSLYKANLEDYYITLDDETTVGNAEGSDITDNVTIINGEYYVNNTTYAQRSFHGSAIPKVYGSFSANVSYKGLSLSALFTYSLGSKVYDSVYASLMSVSGTPSSMHSDILNSWTEAPDGMTETSEDRIDPDGVPMINYGSSSTDNATSSRWLTSGNYLVFKNLTLSYSLPKKWLRPIGVQSVGINVTCENLFTLTARKGMNPQQSFSGSQSNYLVVPRVFTVGLSVKL